jgi:hypothetical protein
MWPMGLPSRVFWRTSCITASSARSGALRRVSANRALRFRSRSRISSSFDNRECDLLRAYQAHLISIGDEARQRAYHMKDSPLTADTMLSGLLEQHRP